MADLQKAYAPPIPVIVSDRQVNSQKKSKSGDIWRSFRNSWGVFNDTEKRNIKIYVVGIMFYKFGIEAFNGSILALATSRWDHETSISGKPPKTFKKLGLLTSLNLVSQCLGSLIVTPLIQKNLKKTVMSRAVLTFGLLTALLLIVDAATGGKLKPRGWDKSHAVEDCSYYGTYKTEIIFPIFCITGLAYGMVETIRRIIPKDIVGGDVQKLIRMDSIVHIFYEVSGTGGSLLTGLVLIDQLGNNMSFIITPIFLAAASITWHFIVVPVSQTSPEDADVVQQCRLRGVQQKENFSKRVADGLAEGVVVFFKSIALGLKILFSSRKYVWLIPSYSAALYTHRFLENNISTAIARRYLGNAAWSQIIVGGSNFGELLGALFVFLFTNLVHSPLPWLRIDSLMLPIVWYLAFWYPSIRKISQALIIAGSFVPLSFGWAAGDVSLIAYIQSQLENEEQRSEGFYDGINPLSAVMSCLYSIYIVLYAILSPLLGTYIDNVDKRKKDIHEAIKYVGGVQFSVVAGIILMATFVPRGSFAFNPKNLNENAKVADIEASSSTELTRSKVIEDKGATPAPGTPLSQNQEAEVRE